MTSHRVVISRTSEDTGYFEIKDPCVVREQDGTYYMYANVGISLTQDWVIGRFKAQHPGGPWEELPPAKLTGVTGKEVCAPAMVLEEKDGKPLWTMYIQTTCFSEDGMIALAQSTDGENFTALPPAMTTADVPKGEHTVVGLYDVALSDIKKDGETYECMVFSAYRQVGCGDVYLSLREKGSEAWEAPVLALKQEDVPFHNRPGTANFEWGLEAAKVVQLADDAFLMVGVAFLDKSLTERGTRQRVFFAASKTPGGPYTAMNTPIEPTAYPEGTGENGHPDTVDMGGKLGLLYQERAGEGKPWHLRYTEMDKAALLAEVRSALAPAQKKSYVKRPGPKP